MSRMRGELCEQAVLVWRLFHGDKIHRQITCCIGKHEDEDENDEENDDKLEGREASEFFSKFHLYQQLAIYTFAKYCKYPT